MNRNQKTIVFFTVLALCFVCFVAAACQPQEKEITGVVFSDLTVEYDGTEKTITATNIPQGVTVSYSNNSATQVGVYTATAVLSGEGYKTLTLTATLTITEPSVPIVTGVTVQQNGSVAYDGEKHSVQISGVPQGATVKTTYNGTEADGVTDAGVYQVKVTVSLEGYTDFVAETTFTVNKAEMANVVIDNASVMYDGEMHAVTVSGAPDGAVTTVTYNGEEAEGVVNAATYKVKVTITHANYNDYVKEVNFTVRKAYMHGISVSADNPVYDGSKKSVTIEKMPQGATVKTTYNGIETDGVTEAGTYEVVVTFSKENYFDATHNLQFIVRKADITGVTLEQDGSVIHDGEAHAPALNGTIPNGVTATWYFNDEQRENVTALGNYEVKVVLEGANYHTLTLTANYKIKVDALDLATTVVNAFGSVPDVWEFLPESFNPDNRAITAPVDYTNFVNVSAIPQNGMGKQMNMVYGVLSKASAVMPYVNIVYGGLNIVKDLYSTYLDNNPQNYNKFSGDAGSFSFTLIVEEEAYGMKATVGPVEIEIISDLASESYGARVQITENTVLKYTVTPDGIIVALNVLGSAATQLTFVREEGIIVGTVYEFLTLADHSLSATSALLIVDENYTYALGTKGDFVPTSDGRNCEVYRNTDGRLVGTEVREYMDAAIAQVTFNTLWYPISDVKGISSIRKVDKSVTDLERNPDEVYVNGMEEILQTKNIGGLSLKTASRRYDVEFKTMYFYVYDSEAEEYVSTESEIPMLFIQEEHFDEFEDDFMEQNGFAANLDVSQSVRDAVEYCYYGMLAQYDGLKDAVTHEDVQAYCQTVFVYA